MVLWLVVRKKHEFEFTGKGSPLSMHSLPDAMVIGFTVKELIRYKLKRQSTEYPELAGNLISARES